MKRSDGIQDEDVRAIIERALEAKEGADFDGVLDAARELGLNSNDVFAAALQVERERSGRSVQRSAALAFVVGTGLTFAGMTVMHSAPTDSAATQEPTEPVDPVAEALEACNRLPSTDLANTCKKDLAVRERRLELCQEPLDGFNQTVCIDAVLRKGVDSSDCDRLPRDLATKCIQTAAKQRVDAKECQRLTNVSHRDDCLSLVASRSPDRASICAQIEESARRRVCYSHYIGSIRDPAKCEELDDELRDECLASVSFHTPISFETCASLDDEGSRNQCMIRIAQRETDPEKLEAACQQTSGGARDRCWQSAMRQSQRPEFCEHLGEPRKSSCILSAARLIREPKLCARIGITGPRDTCYDGLAKLTLEERLCMKIRRGDMRRRCAAYVEQARF